MRILLVFSIYLTLVAFTVNDTCATLTKYPPNKKFKVVLDAGHGGHDSGNRGNGYFEKNIALSIVLAIGKELEKIPDVEVIYTRKNDVFLELWERADIANNANADLFISVHCNAHSSQAIGTETFVLGLDGNAKNMAIAKKENSVIFLEENYEEKYEGFDPNSPESSIGLELMQEEYLDQSINLAGLIENAFTGKVKRKSRGVKQQIFWVLHRSVMPSVLVETGFLTNTSEGEFLNSKTGQEKMAQAIAKAVQEYKKSIQSNEAVYATGGNEDGEVEVISNPKPEKDVIYDNVTFKVQIAASKRKLGTKSYNFKGLKDISRVKEDGLFKYFYGATSNYAVVQRLLEEAKDKGYDSAYIVSFNKNNIKVPLNEVLN